MSLLLRAFAQQSKCNLTLIRQVTALNLNRNLSLKQIICQKHVVKSDGGSQVGEAKPLGEKIKETAKTTSYMGIILLGVGVTGVMFYAIFNELFSSNSPQAIYTIALEKCIKDSRVQDSLGNPIKGFGEESRRRRRTHVAHQLYEKNGRNFMRLSFHIQGIRNKATVHVEMREASSGKFECRYLFVQLDSYPHTTIIIEDNRLSDPDALQAVVQAEASLASGILS